MTKGLPRLDGEPGPKDSPDQIGVGAEVVEPADVAGQERRPLGLAQVVTGQLGVAQLLAGDVGAGEARQDLVQRVRDGDHACTHTVPQPVIHSGTGSQASDSPFQPGTAPISATQLRISLPPLPPAPSASSHLTRTTGSTSPRTRGSVRRWSH